MSKAAAPPGRLPPKEAELFRTVVTCYEQKKYKKGVQVADTILKKFPNHGETLAMKGLNTHLMGKKAEGYELCKAGLKNDVRSHVCWHVLGLLHRADNNYKEAIKCYLNALKIDTDNQNILRDLSWLQIQMRDIPGFVETRKKILDSRPGLKNSWITYAVACYSIGNFKEANVVINKFKETNKKEVLEPYEGSELALFQNSCLEKDGKLAEALIHLEVIKATVVDKLSWSVKKAELLLKAGRYEEAKAEWTTLVTNQPDNYRFHSGFQAAHLQLGPEQAAAAFALKRLELPSTEFSLSSEQLAALRAVYETSGFKSKSLRKLKLTLYSPEDPAFRAELSSFVQSCLKEGMPALYHDVVSLLRIADPFNPSRLIFAKDGFDVSRHPTFVFVSDLVAAYVKNLKEHGHFDAPSAGQQQSELAELPSALLWSLYLQCHLFELRGDLTSALRCIDECITHTPTGIDMYSKRARLLKKQGDLLGAAVSMDECRALDLQDRYLNNKTTKYLLRADETAQAMDTIAMFAKHDGDPQQNLYDMQCCWFALEAGESFARTKQWGPALKKFFAVKKHFNDHYDDMFDFHGYCIRKTTLRAYQDILAAQDNSYTHKFYQRAARGVLRIYLHLLENPEDIDGLAHLSSADRKKERARVKKLREKEKKEAEDKAKAEEEEAKWNANQNKGGEEEGGEDKKKDADPQGELLLAGDFLAEAAVWCGFFSERIALLDSETLALVCEIQMKRGKWLQVVRALSVGLRKDPLSPDLTQALVKVALKMKLPSGKRPTMQPAVAAAVREELSELLACGEGLAVGVFVNKFVEKVSALHSLPHTIAAAVCLYANDKTAALPAITGLLADPAVWTGRGLTFKSVAAALNVLQKQLPNEAFVEEFRSKATALYPTAGIFSSEKPAKKEAAPAAEGLLDK